MKSNSAEPQQKGRVGGFEFQKYLIFKHLLKMNPPTHFVYIIHGHPTPSPDKIQCYVGEKEQMLAVFGRGDVFVLVMPEDLNPDLGGCRDVTLGQD